LILGNFLDLNPIISYGMLKDYHIIIVPKEKKKTKTFRVSGFTLKILLFSAILSIPLFIVSILSTIHYQNKLISLNRNNYENRKLIENKEALIFKLAKLEKNITSLDDTIEHLGEVMDVDPQSLAFGTGPIADLDVSFTDEFDGMANLPEANTMIDEWLEGNGSLTVNKFNRKVSQLNVDTHVLTKQLEEIFTQKKDRINYVTAAPNMLPVQGWVTSSFGMRKHPIGRQFKMHSGIDIASSRGTLIKAPAAGKVIYSGRRGGYGKVLIIQHGYGISTMYAHLNKIYVKKGTKIKRGEKIGEVGSTGYSTGPHLHYEVQVDGIPADPMAFVMQ